jgi:L-histidine N-alpha-methyltransferase
MISQNTQIVSPIAEDVLEGLSRTPKALSPKLFYDQAGSELFEEITRLPEYYLTRTEQQILDEHAPEMVALAGDDLTVVELGAGTAAKTCTILRAIHDSQPSLAFYPVDVSPSPLDAATDRLRFEFPNLLVRPLVADYTSGLPQIAKLPGRKLVLYIGSSIGNFEPMDAASMLARIRRSLAPGDALLVGTDMRKDERILVPAYDDADGVTARFNKNMLARINRELGGDFNLDTFRHVAVWNPRESRMEMYLESSVAQTVRIKDIGHSVRFDAGEPIHTENSYKFTREMIAAILQNAGFHIERSWTDRHKWFALHLARVKSR